MAGYLRKRWTAFLMLSSMALLMAVAAACGEGEQGEDGDETLVFEQASYRPADFVTFEALSTDEVEKVGEAEDGNGREVYRRKTGEKEWQLLTQGDDGWTVWQPAAVAAAVADLAERVDAPEDEVEVREATRVTWPDACLGVPQAGEACAQVLTEGFRIILDYQGRAHEYHSDLGTTIRPLR
jgi:hypothetical protein